MPENRFNLIDEPWIPIADVGRVSLRQIFCEPSYRALGGNAVQKIALTKLLLAIAQAAYTPIDDDDWRNLGADGLAKRCLDYLEKWHDQFWLYGERPFLQMPAIHSARVQPFGAVLPEISSGNTTLLTQSQTQKPLSDAEKAILVVVLMGFGLGGKTDNTVVLTPGYAGKTKDGGKARTGRPGPGLESKGLSHSILTSSTLQKGLWANLFTHEQIASLAIYSSGLGEPPWQNMPKGEACIQAEMLKNSIMGRLIPLSGFCLLANEGLHYSDGIAHQGYKEGMRDPTTAVDYFGKDPKALWVDVEKRPWRQLTALLAFVSSSGQKGFDCPQLRLNLIRARKELEHIGIWTGGISVSGGDTWKQYLSAANDYVESEVVLDKSNLGESWFEILKSEMDGLDTSLKNTVFGCVRSYFKDQNMDGSNIAAQATNLFWQLCEAEFQNLIDACADQTYKTLRRVFAGFADKTYNLYCPKDTARQLDAWAKNKPNFSRYLADL